MPNSRFSNYVSSNNIVIVPTVSFCGPPQKKSKPNTKCQRVTQATPTASSVQRVSCETMFAAENNTNSVPIQENSPNLTSFEDTGGNSLEDADQRVKKTLSWASNYLQSIGQTQPKIAKLTSSASSSQQYITKNLFNPTFKRADVAQSHATSLQLSSYIKDRIENTATESIASSTKKEDGNDAKHPIRINLLYQNRSTDSLSDRSNTDHDSENRSVTFDDNGNKMHDNTLYSRSNKNNNYKEISDSDSKTTNYKKPQSDSWRDYSTKGAYSNVSNNIDKGYEQPKTKPEHTSSPTKKKLYNVATTSQSKSHDKNKHKEKHDRDKTRTGTKPTYSTDKKTPAKYKDPRNDRKITYNETIAPSKRKYTTSKYEYKTKSELKASSSDKTKNESTKCMHSLNKDHRQGTSIRNKTHNEKLERSYDPKSTTRKIGSMKDKMLPKSDDPPLSKNKKSSDTHKQSSSAVIKSSSYDYKTKSKASTKPHTSNDNKPAKVQNSTSIKSVIQALDSSSVKGDLKNDPDNTKIIEDFRTKLKRKHQNSKRDNLVITVQNENDEQKDKSEHQPPKKSSKAEKKTKKYKKIKLVINVVCEKCSESSESDEESKSNDEYPLANVDLSFLDDFNVDDIVDSLNHREDKSHTNLKSPSKRKNANFIENEEEDNKETKCLNLKKSLHPSQQIKIDAKHDEETQEIHNSRLTNNHNDQSLEIFKNVAKPLEGIQIPDDDITQIKTENPDFKKNVNTPLIMDVPNKINASPIEPRNVRINPSELDVKSNSTNISSVQLNQTATVNESPVKVWSSQNNTIGQVVNSKVPKIDETEIVNIKSEDQEKFRDEGQVLIIDLTNIDSDATKEAKISLNKDIVNTQIAKPLSGNQLITEDIANKDDLIDLVSQTEIKHDLEQSVKNQVNGKENKVILAESETSLPKQQDVDTSAETGIIDLTLPTEVISGNIESKITPNVLEPIAQQADAQTSPQLPNISLDFTNNETICNNDQTIVITSESYPNISNKTSDKSESKNNGKENNYTSDTHELRTPESIKTSLINKELNSNIIENIIKAAEPTSELQEHHENAKMQPAKRQSEVKSNITKTTQEPCNDIVNNINVPIVKDVDVSIVSEDVLSITGSLDENLTSYNSETTSDIEPVTDEHATKNSPKIMKSIPEYKKQEDRPLISSNKNESDTKKVVVRLNEKQVKTFSALETRMVEYFGTQYSIESLISKGKFSKIYLCKDDNGRKYALKVLNKGTRIRGCRIEDMLKTLQRDIPRQNYHCVFLIDGFATMEQWCFLMDFYPKNMQEVLYENGKCFHVDTVQVLARQLVTAVLTLRNNNIMHLDIKPTHILMNTSNDRLKLAGFDESQHLEGLSVLPCVGSVNYRPPEVILGFPYFGKIDVWATALVIYEMCTNRQLFPGIYNNDILYKQMCTLGNIPFTMLIQSVFTNKHFRGVSFARRFGNGGQKCVFIDNFKRSKRLTTTLSTAYNRDWGRSRTSKQKSDDLTKLGLLHDLLADMLVLDPTNRMPIEFAYTNSFIYETFDSWV